MKKHIKIKATSCVDMLNAFEDRLAELESMQVMNSRKIRNAASITRKSVRPTSRSYR